MIDKPRKPWISGILTFFAIGLGHIYSGEAKKGIILFLIGQFILLFSMSLLLLPYVPINIVVAILVGLSFLIYCVIDAVKLSRKHKFSYDMKKYNKWYFYLLFWLLTSFLIQPITETAIKSNIVKAYKIPSGAMKQTLQIGDHIIANKFIYKNSEPKRGDIVIFPFPEEPSKDFIKRVVGVGGDVIEIRDKQVLINYNIFQESYKIHTDNRIIPKDLQPRDNYGPVEVPHDCIFVMGDNRDNSYDSRFWGFVKKATVKGKASTIYWSWDREQFRVRWDRIGDRIQ